ncbi:alpha/beta hydrolase [Acidimangrovimonas sediminis]|uniref:alpha/beta hydrolase n=1 Tax=Acidimangrovimonas sediminis TaxID=2056283 RepID=UPI000C8047E8|nr:alpha/beta hydrolase [Acidimangrovimonas sediminis]
MPDYTRLIDEETRAFIHDTEAWYPPDAIDLTIAEQREIYDRMCRNFHRGYPEGVRTEDRALGGVPCRIYEVAAPIATVVYFHGGGFVVGGLESHDDVCAEIAVTVRARVVSVDYRLAPEHRHPAAYDDACAATRAAAGAFTGPLLLAGDSAGGNLAAAVAATFSGDPGAPPIAGQVLIYPGLGGDTGKGSYIKHADAPMLTRDDVIFYQDIRRPEGAADGGAEADPTAAPLGAASFAGLPPTVTFAAECDPLADDARSYAARIAADGGQATCIDEPGLVHGYLRARTTVPRARASFARITAALAALAKGEMP